MPLIELTTIINAPVERCFDLARSIDLHRVSTAGTEEEAIEGVTSGLIGKGQHVTWRARHFGVQQTLTSMITHFEYPYHFRDEMIRGKNIGMKYSPSFLRITSENAAHRFLVKYKNGSKEAHGVYIPRRDTDSMLNVVLAGKLFSWPHYPATFSVNETNENYSVKMRSNDNHCTLQLEGHLSDSFPSDSMFDSLDHASDCFHGCSVGVSPSTKPKQFKTIELKTKTWAVKPLQVRSLKSSYFEDKSLFPDGSIQFDNALLMEGIEHEWSIPGV